MDEFLAPLEREKKVKKWSTVSAPAYHTALSCGPFFDVAQARLLLCVAPRVACTLTLRS
jgi:hypothetical protein